MKQIKIFKDTDDFKVNNWLNEMWSKSEIHSDGNISFIVHDIKMSSFIEFGKSGTSVMVIYEYDV